jgi:hypothetical protein
MCVGFYSFSWREDVADYAQDLTATELEIFQQGTGLLYPPVSKQVKISLFLNYRRSSGITRCRSLAQKAVYECAQVGRAGVGIVVIVQCTGKQIEART